MKSSGRNLADSQAASSRGRSNQVRPKSEKFRTVAAANSSDRSSTNLIRKNLDDYLLGLSNFELKQKLDSCPGKLNECPVLNGFREGLKKSISSHVNLTPKNDSRACKTSRILPASKGNVPKENSNKSMEKLKETSDEKGMTKDVKTTTSNTSRGVIRSTRAQDLRCQSNRDLLKPKTTCEKTRTTSPYVTALAQKKKASASGGPDAKPALKSAEEKKKKQQQGTSKSQKGTRSPYKGKPKKEKASSAGEEVSLQRERTREVINPKIVKKSTSNHSAGPAGDCGPPELKKSQTFFICKGTKKGGGDVSKGQAEHPSEGNLTDEDLPSPKPRPLTHNDSFCLIVKSSQKWSQKNRSDDEKLLRYGLPREETGKKGSERGILKNSNHDLKSVDSLEKMESEKIVRFSDELLRNKKVLKKLVRRKKRLQNFFAPNWYQKNKLFQKYLEILREKSVLLSDRSETPEDLKPFRVPLHVKERHEAEMFGLCPRKGKSAKNQTKDAYSY